MAKQADMHRRGQSGPGAERVRRALDLVRSGVVFDLDIGRFPGMPRNPAQPAFDVVTYRSPKGLANERRESGKGAALDEDNFGFVLELVTTSMHMGTHIDALCHVTAGEGSEGYEGFQASEHVGDKGVLRNDATTLPAIVARGVLLDVAAALGTERLVASHGITVREIELAIDLAGITLEAGDVVLVRTGYLREPTSTPWRSEPTILLSRCCPHLSPAGPSRSTWS
jgi:kynurenine formamidase